MNVVVVKLDFVEINTTAINNVGGKVTPVIGAIGNLINALNRSSLGGGFGGGFGGGPPRFKHDVMGGLTSTAVP